MGNKIFSSPKYLLHNCYGKSLNNYIFDLTFNVKLTCRFSTFSSYGLKHDQLFHRELHNLPHLKSDLYYLINTSSGIEYNQTSTELCLTAEYNTPLQVSVVAVNCAGRSEPAIANISMGMSMIILCDTSYYIILPQLAVVLPVHQ